MRPLAEFVAEINARGAREDGWLRWRTRRLISRVRIWWFVLWHKPLPVSAEAFAAVSADANDLAIELDAEKSA